MDGDGTHDRWLERTRVVLQPTAAPSILGLYGFAGATFIVAAHLAGWYGGPDTPQYLWPFAALFGGLAQFIAGLWAYRARDGLATAMHGMWGSFWMAWGILHLLGIIGLLDLSSTAANTGEGWWFIALGAITFMGAVAAIAESFSLVVVLGLLAFGSGLNAAGLITGINGYEIAAGYVFVTSAAAAFYTASAMMLEETFGKVILPLGKRNKDANVPGRSVSEPISYGSGQPGVKVGQ